MAVPSKTSLFFTFQVATTTLWRVMSVFQFQSRDENEAKRHLCSDKHVWWAEDMTLLAEWKSGVEKYAHRVFLKIENEIFKAKALTWE